MSILVLMLSACRQRANNRIKLTGLDTISFANLSKRAYDYLYAKQDECESTYHIGKFEHWYYDQTTGKLTLSNKDTIKLVIDYEDVGSVSLKSNTWLWSWANSSIEPKVKSEIPLVHDYGRTRRFGKLTNAKWTADLYDGWEMTAIAAYLLKAKGAYRAPINDSLYSFMIFKNSQVTDSIIRKG
jgi:hypothetical protein